MIVGVNLSGRQSGYGRTCVILGLFEHPSRNNSSMGFVTVMCFSFFFFSCFFLLLFLAKALDACFVIRTTPDVNHTRVHQNLPSHPHRTQDTPLLHNRVGEGGGLSSCSRHCVPNLSAGQQMLQLLGSYVHHQVIVLGLTLKENSRSLNYSN